MTDLDRFNCTFNDKDLYKVKWYERSVLYLMEQVLRMMKVLNGHSSERKSTLKALYYPFKT